MATSRRAAIGATRLARSAGATAEATVTTTPTTTDVMIVAAVMTVGPDGMSRPTLASSSRSPNDIPIPRPRPAAQATSPTATASSSTERRTCRRPAPIARSMARSRVRWAMTIENVL